MYMHKCSGFCWWFKGFKGVSFLILIYWVFVLFTHYYWSLALPPLYLSVVFDWSSLTAGGMLSFRSVCPVAVALTDLFLSAVTLRAAASVGLALWADAATCVAKVTKGARLDGRWSVFPWKPCSRDGAGLPAQGGVPGERTGLWQG